MVCAWGERHDVDPDFSPIPLEAVALDLLKRLDAAEASCVWAIDEWGYYDSACGWSGLVPSGFCPGCGHPVQVKQKEDSHD